MLSIPSRASQFSPSPAWVLLCFNSNFFDHVLVDVRKDADRCERLGGIRNVILMIWHNAIDFEGGNGVVDLVEIDSGLRVLCGVLLELQQSSF